MKTPMNIYNTAMKKKKEPQGILPGRADRCSGNYGNPGGSSGSDLDWLY